MMQEKELNRRSFLQKSVYSIGYALMGGVVWSTYLTKSQAQTLALRPPAALSESEFLATCLHCGMCVSACPFDVLKLANTSDDVPTGTPYFTPRENACRLCPDVPCASACPTDALDLGLLRKKEHFSINNARMGLARVNTASCLAHLGLQCTICIRACPLEDVAIIQKNERNERTGMHAYLTPLVNPDNCTGCGLCEHACPTDMPSIKVLPLFLSAYERGSHYVVGWDREDEARAKQKTADVTMKKTKRNEKSALDNVNDVDGILKGLYNE